LILSWGECYPLQFDHAWSLDRLSWLLGRSTTPPRNATGYASLGVSIEKGIYLHHGSSPAPSLWRGSPACALLHRVRLDDLFGTHMLGPARYSHITVEMRCRLLEGLTNLGNAALDQRMNYRVGLPVTLLDAPLRQRRLLGEP